MQQQGAPTESSLIGVTLDNGKYRILHLIGRGGMGEVYEAEHVALGHRVAVKLMLDKYTGDAEAVTRFTREALAATRIGNPHIIQVIDVGTAPDERSYVIMELLQGAPLSRVLEECGALPPQRAVHIIRQVLRAVGAAHAKGIVHRDLKPDNIFLIDQGEQQDFVKLLDFGISKMIDPDLQAAATRLTTTGVVMGTPLYMAPEQAMGLDIDHLADIYACGVILYEMLAGRPPFDGATYAVLVAKLLTSDPPLLGEVRPGLSPKLVAAVHRALEKEPKSRFASADAFIAGLPSNQSASAVELAGTVTSGATSVAPISVSRAAAPLKPATPGRSKRPVLAATLALIAGIASAIVVFVVRGPEDAPPAPTPTVATEANPTTTVTAIETGQLTIETIPDGARVIVDGIERGTSKLSVALLPGPHRVRLELEGYQPTESTEEITPNVERSLKLQLPPAPAGITPTPTKPARSTSTRSKAAPGKTGTPDPATSGAAGATTTSTVDRTVVRPDPTPPPPPPVKKEPKPNPTLDEPKATKSNPYGPSKSN